ncbi:hypothetical protein R3P38DRAFT_3140216 [Favolaschia claudopus]|uniref:Uncharacterized protein n=1 Tax=Favolaschia claudopus TaxID=2862362 RepID=A0AAV9Z6B5_9AGAR
MLAKLTLATLALAGSAMADFTTGGLKILAPGGDNLWWPIFISYVPSADSSHQITDICSPVTAQPNNIAWSCSSSSFSTFTMWINNSDITLLTAITPLIAIENNFNCVQGLDGNIITMPVGKGYTIVLSNPSNLTDVYAVSDPFEIKALSAGYPPETNTPKDTGSATVSKGSATNVVSQTGAPSGSPSQPPNGAVSVRSGMATAGAIVGAAVLAALL